MTNKILVEEIKSATKLIVEDTAIPQEKNYYIEGIFMQSDVKNRNGRVYPKDIMDKEVSRYVSEMVLTNRSVGELGHPPTTQVNADRISHLITELQIQGNDIKGKAKLLDTPMGQIAKNLVKEGVKFGVSSRGYGTTKTKGNTTYVGDDFRLVTVDIVLDPSAPDAFVSGLMENSDFYLKQGILTEEDLSILHKRVKNLSKVQLNEGALLNMFKDFMSKI